MAEGKVVFKHVFSVNNPGKLDDYYLMDRKSKQMLGEGSYGKVKRAQNIATKEERAVKMIQKKSLKKDAEAKFERETQIQQSLDHAHIVRLYEVFSDPQFYYLIMEICDGGELFDRITEAAEAHEGSAFDEVQAADYMIQIFHGMSYLHSKQIAHRDIKPENFLMHTKAKDAQIKIIDFGLAKKYQVGERMKTKAGTPYYVAPEVLKGDYNHTCDVWSCGVLLYIFICGYPPFYGDDDKAILAAVKSMKFEYPDEDWSSVSKEAKDIINRMLSPEKDRTANAQFEALMKESWCTSHATKTGGSLNKDLGTRLAKFRRQSQFKKIAITCIAQQCNDKDIEDLKQSFTALDENGNGLLTADEIKEGFRKHKIQMPEDLVSVINDLDTDGSGQIDFTEFIAATLEESIFRKEELMWAAFRVFDTDHDGQITTAEIKKATGMVDEDIRKMVEEADTNRDGSISFEEFKAMMKSNPKYS